MKLFKKCSFMIMAIMLILIGHAGCSFEDPKAILDPLPEAPDALAPELDDSIFKTWDKLDEMVRAAGDKEVLLNLANEDEYKFLMNRLAMGNKNSKNSPRLFSLIEKTRQSHVKKGKSSRATIDTGSGHFVVDIKLDQKEQLVVAAEGNVLDTSPYIYLDGIARDEDKNILTSYNYSETYDGSAIKVTSEGSVSEYVVRKGTYSDSRVIRPPTTKYKYVNANTFLIYEVPGQELVISYYVYGQSSDYTYPLDMHIKAPIEIDMTDQDSIVKVCLYRKHDDCDYYINPNDVSGPEFSQTYRHIRLPFKGHIDFGFPIYMTNNYKPDPAYVDDMGVSLRKADIRLTLKDVKGGYYREDIESFFWDHVNTRVTASLDEDGNVVMPESRLQWDLSDRQDWIDFGYEAFRHCELVELFIIVTVPLIKDSAAISQNTAIPGTAFIVPESYFEETSYEYRPTVSNMKVYENRTHTLWVKGIDNNGDEQADANATQYTWTVDTTAPTETLLYNKPAATTVDKKFAIFIDGAEIDAYTYKLTSVKYNVNGTVEAPPGNWKIARDISIPISEDVSDESFTSIEYYLSVRGLDKAGNEQEISETYSWVIVNTQEEPEALISDNNTGDIPSFYYNNNQIQFKVGGADLSYYRYDLYKDNVLLEAQGSRVISSLIEYNGLTDGMYTLKVYGAKETLVESNIVEEWQLTPTEFSWKVDTTVPDAGLHMAAATGSFSTPSKNIEIQIKGDDVIRYLYSLDDASAFDTTGDVGIEVLERIIETDLTVGQHTLRVIGMDRAGNWQVTPTTYTWTIVDGDPAIDRYAVLTNLPDYITKHPQINISVSGNDLKAFKFKIPTDEELVYSEEIPLKNYINMPNLQFAYSCVAWDTEITMADGGRKLISNMEDGDVVVSGFLDRSGESRQIPVPVYDVVTGNEVIPMYRIMDQHGNSILITEGHPFVMANYSLKAAKDIKEGDLVVTENGVSEIIRVDVEMYDDTVYNLTLGRSADKGFWRNRGYSMFANGFLIGDNTMQLEEQSGANRPYKGDPLKRLPEEWHEDYKNSLRNGKIQ